MEEARARRLRQRRRYNASPKGIARNLRAEHGFDVPTSMRWTLVLVHPNTRCAICGMPNRRLEWYRRRGWPFFLGRREGAGSHPHLTLDHIEPGCDTKGHRPLCGLCNRLRGADNMSDDDVLVLVREKWLWFTTPRFLWWLNTSPGEGGRLFRSLRVAKRAADQLGGASAPAWEDHDGEERQGEGDADAGGTGPA